MDKETLFNLKLMPNMVLVKLDQSSYKIKLSGGIVLELAWTFTPEQHTPIRGEVVSVCDRLHFKANHAGYAEPGSLKWDTPLQVIPGDTVIMNWFSVMTTIGLKANPYNKDYLPVSEKSFFIDNELYVIMDYGSLIFAIRELPVGMDKVIRNIEEGVQGYIRTQNLYEESGSLKEIIPLNGYVIVKPLYEKEVTSEVIKVQVLGKTKRINAGEVIWTGRPNKQYTKITSKTDYPFDDEGVKNGQVVALDKDALNRVGNNPDGEFYELLYVQRWQIMAILSEPEKLQGSISIDCDD